MVQAVRLYETGGPEVMKLEEVTLEAPGPGMVTISTLTIAVAYIRCPCRPESALKGPVSSKQLAREWTCARGIA